MSSSASARWRRSRTGRVREEQRRREKPGSPACFERDLDRLAHGELREQTRRLERAPEPLTCRAAPAPCRDTSAP